MIRVIVPCILAFSNEDNCWYAFSTMVNIVSDGDTKEIALMMFRERLEIMVDSTIEYKTIDKVFSNLQKQAVGVIPGSDLENSGIEYAPAVDSIIYDREKAVEMVGTPIPERIVLVEYCVDEDDIVAKRQEWKSVSLEEKNSDPELTGAEIILEEK